MKELNNILLLFVLTISFSACGQSNKDRIVLGKEYAKQELISVLNDKNQHNIIDNKIYIPTRHYYKQVEWEDLNKWALGLPINPMASPLNLNNWNSDNIDESPMFKSQQSNQLLSFLYTNHPVKSNNLIVWCCIIQALLQI